MLAKPLINLDIALLRACQNSTVVAASERIKRALLQAYDAHQVERGLRTWRSARVLTLGAYLKQRHDELLQADHSDRILLGANAQRLAWLGHTPESTEIDFDAIYDDVANAWQIVHDWDLAAELQQFVDNDNHRLFRDWASRYRRAAERRRWLTEAELPGLITAELATAALARLSRDIHRLRRCPASACAVDRRATRCRRRGPSHPARGCCDPTELRHLRRPGRGTRQCNSLGARSTAHRHGARLNRNRYSGRRSPI